PRKPISVWFTSSACVASMPWGAPATTTNRLSFTASCVRIPVAEMGRTRSASSCIERGHLELSKVAAEVGQPACRAIDGGLRGGAGSLVPAITDDLFTNALSQQRVEVVEVLVPTGQEGEPILCDRALDSLYRGLVQWPGILGCLQQVRSNPGENRGLADAAGPILADVSSHLSAAHRESDERDVTQVELGDELVE